jgi:hypothetical protein
MGRTEGWSLRCVQLNPQVGIRWAPSKDVKPASDSWESKLGAFFAGRETDARFLMVTAVVPGHVEPMALPQLVSVAPRLLACMSSILHSHGAGPELPLMRPTTGAFVA